MNNVNLISVGRNSLGTANLVIKVDSKMRKEQSFCVYPLSVGETTIKIQSDTRIGRINLLTGKGILTKSYSGGAYGHHLQLGEKFDIECNSDTLNGIIEAIRNSSKHGNNCVIHIMNEGKDLLTLN